MNVFDMILARVTAGMDFFANIQFSRDRADWLGTAVAEGNIVARPVYLRGLLISNSSTATTIYLGDGGTGTGATNTGSGFLIPIYVPATSTFFLPLGIRCFSFPRMQGSLSASLAVTGIGE